MTEENQQHSTSGLGTRLKIARESLRLSQKDAAVRLHLGPNIIQIIESEDFRQAPPVTFMRGYIRSYAKLLNMAVADDEINLMLVQAGLELAPKAPIAPMLQTETIQRTDRYVHLITMLILAISLVFVGIWWNSHSRDAASEALRTAAQAPTEPPQTVQQAPQPVVATNAPQAVVNTPTPAVPATPATPAATAAQPMAATAAPDQAIANPAVAANTPAAAPPAPVAQQAAPAPVVAPQAPAVATAAPNNPAPAATNNPAAPAGTVVAPAAGGAPALATAAPAQPTVGTDPTNTEQPRKKHRRHSEELDTQVSGMAMALPEPGLESN